MEIEVNAEDVRPSTSHDLVCGLPQDGDSAPKVTQFEPD